MQQQRHVVSLRVSARHCPSGVVCRGEPHGAGGLVFAVAVAVSPQPLSTLVAGVVVKPRQLSSTTVSGCGRDSSRLAVGLCLHPTTTAVAAAAAAQLLCRPFCASPCFPPLPTSAEHMVKLEPARLTSSGVVSSSTACQLPAVDIRRGIPHPSAIPIRRAERHGETSSFQRNTRRRRHFDDVSSLTKRQTQRTRKDVH